MGCQAPGGSGSCLEFLPGSLSVSIHSGTGLRGVLVPLGAGESWNATAELHLGRGRSRRRGGGGADWGGLSCHIPQGESSWAPCPYLGRRCLLTWVCGMPRQDASSSPGGWGRLSTVGAKSGAKSANFGIEDPSRPRHLRVQQVQSLRRQSALSANKTVITICGRPSVPAHKLQGALILTAGWVAMLLDG